MELEILKKIKIINSKIIAVITDYDINPYWINKTIDNFVIPHKILKNKLTKNGVNPSKILTLGIPIDPKFSLKIDIQKITQKYSINKEKTNTQYKLCIPKCPQNSIRKLY